MNAKGTWLLKGLSIASLLFPVFLPQPALCADLTTGKVVWWGRDFVLRAPNTEHTNGVIEVDNEVLTNVVAIAAGQEQVLALESDSTVISVGSGGLGLNIMPPGLSNVVSVALEGNSRWAIKHDGSVARWGNEDHDEANIVAGLSNVTAIAWAGAWSYLALRNDGTVLGFRFESEGLTNASAAEPPVRPARVRGQVLTNVAALAPGGGLLVLKKDGTVFRLGYQTPGIPPAESDMVKMPDGSLAVDMGGAFRKTPYDYTSADQVMVSGQALSNVTAIAEGGGQALALKNDGTVVAWGSNNYDGTAMPEGLSNVTAIAAAERHKLALISDGTVVAWGNNDYGQTSVPAGLSNVVAIAAGDWFGIALTTGNVPSSVFTYPHGRLEEMEREADLIFKGRVISTSAATNASFPAWGKPHATRFSLISALQGNVHTNELVFWHNTGEPGSWSGGRPPSSHHFEPGNSYLVFAARLDKPDDLYSVPPDATNRPNEFRQLYRDGVMCTLDARPVGTLRVKDAHWAELGLLLNDTNPTNQLYGIETLDRMSLAGRRDDPWSRSADFKRKVILDALLPLATNGNEQVASRVISCFATESNAAVKLASFAAALVRVGNESHYPTCRLAAISALSGTSGEAVSNSVAQLLNNPDENIRLGAVRLLPRFPKEFAEQALCAKANDPSANVRSVVADVIGDERYERVLPTLAKLFGDPVGRDRLIEPLTMDFLRAGLRWSNIGDVHTSVGLALVKFDPAQVADILRTNLNDVGFHINFVSKLAEKDAEPWLPELVSILEARLRYVEDVSKSPPLDPRRFADPQSNRALIGTYAKCWEDIRQYLLKLPPEKLSDGGMDRYMDLLDKTVRLDPGSSGGCVQEARSLYELYWTKGLAKRAGEVRRRYDKTDGWWFDDFQRSHPAATNQ